MKQFVMPGPEAEVAFIIIFLTDIGELENLVTYNGKSFDWPQVKTRHTFVRDRVPKLPKVGHYDLLHAARRLWKGLLPSCKLAVVEEEILRVKRENETASYLVPMLYFDFVNEQDPMYLAGVLKHHEWDVLSLITLYTHLAGCVLDAGKGNLLPLEQYEIARWYEYLGEKELAARLYEQLTVLREQVGYDSLLAFGKIKKSN